MSLQSVAKPPVMKNKRQQRAAERYNLNAVLLKAIWLDVDLKDVFKDTAEAAAAFDRWRRAVGLPAPSLIVFSGSGGFHVYWVFDEPVTPQVWEPLAFGLVAACEQIGFKADTGRSKAAAQLMRLPGSFNQKHTP